jgi:hypothetical protein
MPKANETSKEMMRLALYGIMARFKLAEIVNILGSTVESNVVVRMQWRAKW